MRNTTIDKQTLRELFLSHSAFLSAFLNPFSDRILDHYVIPPMRLSLFCIYYNCKTVSYTVR